MKNTLSLPMKKWLPFASAGLLLIILAVIAAVTLPICGGNDAPESESERESESESVDEHFHTFSSLWTSDENYHWHDANCGHNLIYYKAPHDFSKGSVCSICLASRPPLSETAISAYDFTEAGNNTFRLTLSNDTEFYSFLNRVEVSENASYEVYTDVECDKPVLSKSVSLQIGNNTVYILVTAESRMELYTFVIRRRPLYTLSFDTKGGSAVDAFSAEESLPAKAPDAVPVREGYTFIGWDYDFDAPVTGDSVIGALYHPNVYTVTLLENGGICDTASEKYTFDASYTLPVPVRVGYIFKGWADGTSEALPQDGVWTIAGDKTLTALWEARTDIVYTVNHYLENANDTAFTLNHTETLHGTADGTVTPKTAVYQNFLSPEAETVSVSPDGTLTVSYYYTRKTVTLSFVLNGGEAISPIVVKYGATDVFPEGVREGYTFGGFYFDPDMTSPAVSVPAADAVLYAYWQEETKASAFIHTETADAACINGFNGEPTALTVPSYIAGKPVTKLGNWAFYGCKSLKSVSLPDSITELGSDVFAGCEKLGSVTLPENVAKVGNDTFYNCKSLVFVSLPSTLEKISNWTFYGCESLSSVSLPSGIKTVGDCAFYNCRSLVSITLPDSVETVSASAFYNCPNLISVTVTSALKEIGASAFYKCVNLTDIYYGSTVSDWDSVTKGSRWNQYYAEGDYHFIPVTVHGSDGDTDYSE